jgi:uncharacterized membrane protein SpoIIM required for sporulation
MDLDRYVTLNRPQWQRLADLTKEVRRRPKALSPSEVDEFIGLYRRVSSQLSFARSHYQDPTLTAELNHTIGMANAALYQRTASPIAGLRRFFSVSFPAAVWHLRRTISVAALLFFVPAIVVAVWLSSSERALDVAAPEATRAAYVNEDFENYYSSEPASQFATEVLINNIQVSFLAFALGAFLCIGTVYVLVFNGFVLGGAWAVFIVAGQQSKFFGLILPHGLLEITSILVAGAAGLSMGWAIISPGDRTRAAAFTAEARRSIVIVLGLMLAFIVAGLIEGFITPGLSTAPRVTIGVVVELLFVSYVVAFGRRAESLGFTGLSNEFDSGRALRAAITV